MRAWPATGGARRCPGGGPAAARARHRDAGSCARPRRVRRPACTSAASRRTTRPTSATRRPTSPSTWCSRAWRDAGHDGALRAERHRRRRPAARARRARRRGLARASPSARPTLFREDMAALRVLPPGRLRRRRRGDPAHRRRRSTACRASGAAYDVDGDVYFSVHADPRLRRGERPGRGRRCCALFAERGGDPDRPGKKRPARLPAVAGRRGPASRRGTSPLGRGRPGWHIECAAIALEPPRQRLRRAGRRHRPGLPAPRDGRLAGAGR